MKPPVVRPPAAGPARRPAEAPLDPDPGRRREAWLKLGVLFCGAALAGVLGAAWSGADDAPAPRVEVQPTDENVVYEDQYVRIWANPPESTPTSSTETSP